MLFRVSKVVNDATVNAEARKALGGQLDQAIGRQVLEAHLASLKQKADVQINRKAIEKGG